MHDKIDEDELYMLRLGFEYPDGSIGDMDDFDEYWETQKTFYHNRIDLLEQSQAILILER